MEENLLFLSKLILFLYFFLFSNQFQAAAAANKDETTTTITYYCPNKEWLMQEFGGKTYCYMRIKLDVSHRSVEVNANLLTKDICKRKAHPNSRLASIHSKFENQWLYSKFPNAMIGLYIPIKMKWGKHNFRWNDGTKVDFLSWDKEEDPKQPDNEKPTERYVKLRNKNRSHGWHDYRMIEMKSAVCKMAALKKSVNGNEKITDKHAQASTIKSTPTTKDTVASKTQPLSIKTTSVESAAASTTIKNTEATKIKSSTTNSAIATESKNNEAATSTTASSKIKESSSKETKTTLTTMMEEKATEAAAPITKSPPPSTTTSTEASNDYDGIIILDGARA